MKNSITAQLLLMALVSGTAGAQTLVAAKPKRPPRVAPAPEPTEAPEPAPAPESAPAPEPAPAAVAEQKPAAEQMPMAAQKPVAAQTRPEEQLAAEKSSRSGLTGAIALAVLPETGLGRLKQTSFTAMPYAAWFPGRFFQKDASREYCSASRGAIAETTPEYAQKKADRVAANEIRRYAAELKAETPDIWTERIKAIERNYATSAPPEAKTAVAQAAWSQGYPTRDDPSQWSDEFAFVAQEYTLGYTYWEPGAPGRCALRDLGVFLAIPLNYDADVAVPNGTFARSVTSVAAAGVAWSPHAYLSVMAGVSLGRTPDRADATARHVWVLAPVVAIGSNIDILRGVIKP